MTAGILKYIILLIFILLVIVQPYDSDAGSLHPKDSVTQMLSFVSDPAVSTDSSECIIPFTRAGNLILIKAKADTTEGNFILDTGAPHLVLNLTYFRNYKSTSTNDVEQGGITGGLSAVTQSLVSNLSFGGVRYSGVECDIANLGHLENNKGVRIFGLLGMQLFKQFEMIIDYEKNLIFLHLISKRDGNGYMSDQLKDEALYKTFPVDIIENKLIARTMMAGKKLQFIIDTGAESNVLDSRLPNKILENVVISRRVLLTGTGNTKVDALYGDLKNMTLSGTELGTLPVLVTNLANMCQAYERCLDGLLGFDFLSLHKIGFNFVQRKMYIWK